MTSESGTYLATLHKQIDRYFNLGEVQTLCFELGVDYENIPGNYRSAFIRNLIVSLAKRNRLQELVDKVRAERPFVDWADVPADLTLPEAIASENIQQVVHYSVYGDVVHGDKGDKVGGDKIGGDKVGGDHISVDNISNADGVAIGGGAAASVQSTTIGSPTAGQPPPAPAGAKPTSPAAVPVQKAADRLNRYVQMADEGQQETAADLAASVEIILAVAAAQPPNPRHLKLLFLGQQQLARELSADIPGIEQVVAQFITAVRAQRPD